MDTFELKVIVPAGEVVSAEAHSALLPTLKGEVQILPLHAEFTGLLSTGVMEFVQKGSSNPTHIAVAGGFLEYSNGVLKILADAAYTSEMVDRKNYASERTSCESIVAQGDSRAHEWITAKRKLDSIQAIDALLAH